MKITAYWLIKDNRRIDKLGYRMKQFDSVKDAINYISKFRNKMVYNHFDFKYNMRGNMSCYNFEERQKGGNAK